MVLNSTFENLASFSLTLVTIAYQNRALEKRITLHFRLDTSACLVV